MNQLSTAVGITEEQENDDGSEVFDWFYDVSELEADGGVFEEPVRTKEEIEALCADRKRYEEGASFTMP